MRTFVLAFMCLVALNVVVAQENSAFLLQQGMEAYGKSDFNLAQIRFREILSNPQAHAAFYPDAFFWSVRTSMALGRLEEAAKNLEHFLVTWPAHPYAPEALYEKGRLFHLTGEHETAVQVFSDFMQKYKTNVYYPNALYWTGESLFNLGKLAEARKVFQEVITAFPTSFRVEAARYRLALIELKDREEELLKLLKWSHEEYMKALEEFRNKERTYAEAIASYQKRIADLQKTDLQGEIQKLNSRIAVLEGELSQKNTTISQLEAKIKELEAQVAEQASRLSLPVQTTPQQSTSQQQQQQQQQQVQIQSAQAQVDARTRVLAVKEAALRLKELYIEFLGSSGGR